MVELPEIVRGRFQWESLWAEKSPCRSVGWLTGCVRCDGGDFEVREYGEAAVDHCGSRHRDSQFGRRNLEFVVLCPGVGVLLGASH